MTNAIDIQDFSYRYPDGTVALSHISLSIEHGQKAVLIGPNGAGKSSLLMAIAGFARGSGRVLIDGIESNKKNMRSIRAIAPLPLSTPTLVPMP